MSRSLRHKSPPTPRTPLSKKSRQNSRTTDISSDDDYGGVDLISDDDESEPDVEGVEEQAIIDSEADDEDEDDDDLETTPRPFIDEEETWEGFGPDTAVIPSGTFFDEHISRMNAPDHDTEATLWNATASSVFTDTDTPSGRRVHFDLSDSESDDDAPNEDSFYPDIFVDQNSLAPSFRREIHRDIDADNRGGFWDFSDNETAPAKNDQDDKEDNSDYSTGSSGYETDEGETTEEDLPPAASFIQAPGRSVLRRLSDASSGSEEEITVTRRHSMRNRGPVLASWVHDLSKPFAVLDSHGKKLIMFKATVKRRVSFSGTSNRRTLETVPEMNSEMFSPGDQMSPMISNSGNIMLGAMSTSIDQYAGLGPALGPPEAFHPFTSVDANGTITQDSMESWDEDEFDEDEHVWRLDDFFKFSEGESSDDEGGDGDNQDPSPSSDAAEPSSLTPKRPATATSEDQAHPLLDHFEVRNVGSFRKNQNLHTQLTRHAVSSDALAFSGPYGVGTLKGIKGGRLAAANSPITPMPRDRNLELFANSPSSPLSKASSNNKRKYDGDYFSHKRSRSAM
ncbi:hypothetical protein HYFRA_00010311 [Hymenoscyphus fraxineus]|uniref:Uncharacterized protein n=1 Tax=Hymenoscyphus fraxineus TaxID=746836 RepID=A0A9N9PTQ2_9HELO|nr:hypothetical protein HYFRA_00010311 [Hymenoscyphus fraxineus]